MLAGIHLAELARPRRSGRPGGEVLRTASDVLSGFPSIVLGYVVYVALVVGLHWGYSLLPAVLVLSVMVVPYIAKSTEVALRQVPDSYREGAEALGMSTGYALRKVVLRSGGAGDRDRPPDRPGHRRRARRRRSSTPPSSRPNGQGRSSTATASPT